MGFRHPKGAVDMLSGQAAFGDRRRYWYRPRYLTVSSTLPTLLAMTFAASRPPLPGRHELVGDAMETAAVAFGDREAYDDGSRRLTSARRCDVVAIAPPR